MRRKNAEIIVKTILEGCPPPHLILGQEDCSRLELSRTKEVLQAGNHDAFLRTFPELSSAVITLSCGRTSGQIRQTRFS
jgi:hypothetical protein